MNFVKINGVYINLDRILYIKEHPLLDGITSVCFGGNETLLISSKETKELINLIGEHDERTNF